MIYRCTFIRLAPLALALITGAVLAAPLTNMQKEIAVAKIHATVASKIDALPGVQLHLHHVVNCLVGPHGAEYSAKAEAVSANHCDDLGNGAIADAKAEPQVRHLAQTALQQALAGIKATSLPVAHREATEVLRTLNAAEHAERNAGA